ncbi:HlyD family efflux transporter periplasmic adaptor subunit [Pseudomonas sp. ADAK18]|uniref:HlyD family secretion protein n=1 Tax=Pseudomonas sp. ADAK18 TaxID=2730848 RepID=UPI0014636E3C|nr:HlyD family efflux transporter periplasmic adaptor subunit [Pseudomonas sp. ADAK18]QJI30069.1 HlyD family efflux transporter periplasmic adaptor subunit [Pseudomonas sp. ADAK18]
MGDRLFRSAASDAQRVKWLGEIVLIRPTSFAFLTVFALAMLGVVGGFFIWGSYTKRSTVSGQLVPASGQIKVRTPQTGVVLEKFVAEGQAVVLGDPLLSISSERYGSGADPVQARVSYQLKQRRESLDDELQKTWQLHQSERDSLSSKVATLRNELTNLAAQLASQRERVALADDASSRYQELMQKGYISMDQFQQRQAELLGQRQALQSLDRERTSITQQLTERRNELAGLDTRQANELAPIRRQLSGIEQELAESEAKRTLLITAPGSGIATAVLAEVGQTVDPSRTLLSIMPRDSQLQAELYAPSKSVGFIRPGDAVLIRYQAYPYQKFGQYQAQVLSISRTAVPSADLAVMAGEVPGLSRNGEQLYRLRVQLNEQSVMAYGKPQPLQSGMLLDADILQESRRLYEWVLEPLYSLTGKY